MPIIRIRGEDGIVCTYLLADTNTIQAGVLYAFKKQLPFLMEKAHLLHGNFL